MIKEMKIPSPGESITEVEIAQWLVQDGDYVELDQAIAEIDSDKATLELNAEFAGAIKILIQEGAVEVGTVVCSIDTSAKAPAKAETKPVEKAETKKEEPKKEVKSTEKAVSTPATADLKASPVAKEMIKQNQVPAAKIQGSGPGGKIMKADIEAYFSGGLDSSAASGWGGTREENREKMSMLRRKVAQRLVSVKNETAMLTTFNEVDMSKVMEARNKYKDAFR